MKDQPIETPFEEQRASALEFYDEMSHSSMMSSSFIKKAISSYNPDLTAQVEELKSIIERRELSNRILDIIMMSEYISYYRTVDGAYVEHAIGAKGWSKEDAEMFGTVVSSPIDRQENVGADFLNMFLSDYTISMTNFKNTPVHVSGTSLVNNPPLAEVHKILTLGLKSRAPATRIVKEIEKYFMDNKVK